MNAAFALVVGVLCVAAITCLIGGIVVAKIKGPVFAQWAGAGVELAIICMIAAVATVVLWLISIAVRHV